MSKREVSTSPRPRESHAAHEHRDPDALEAEGHADIARGHAKLAEAAMIRRRNEQRGGSRYLDQHTSPLSKRVFLEHARRGSFPTRRVGKRVLVERDVFEQWLAQQDVKPRRAAEPPPSGPRRIDDEVLAELGAVATANTRRRTQ